MIIITEGVDRSGKTSIADYISDKFKLFKRYQEIKDVKNLISFSEELEKWSYFEAGSVGYMLPMFRAFDNFVIDRFHFSSYVYNKFFKRKEYIDFDYKENFMFDTKKEIIILYCDVNYDNYYKRHFENNEEPLNESDFNYQKELFAEAMKKTRFQYAILDTNKPLGVTTVKVDNILNI